MNMYLEAFYGIEIGEDGERERRVLRSFLLKWLIG